MIFRINNFCTKLNKSFTIFGSIFNHLLEVLEKNFPEYESEWTPKIQKMIPSYGKSLINDNKAITE
jgi:L-2-hydroxyglutarate oxidase LhgO